ncbi:MAG: hypothetical protein ACI8T1_003299 [Verrucomicrobiales bacterium]|jgi:hypothetical protein
MDVRGIDEFRISGYLGANGSGSLDGTVLEMSFAGQSHKGFVKRVFNAGDPSVNHLIIVPDSDSATHIYSSTTNSDIHTVSGLGDVDQLFYLLFASTNGGYVTEASMAEIMEAFVKGVALSLPWLGLEFSEGTVAPGASASVTLNFAATGIDLGDYGGVIRVSSNDADTPVVDIPLALSVVSAPMIAALPRPVDPQ